MFAKPIKIACALFAAAAPAAAQTELEDFHAYASHSVWQQEIAAKHMAANPDVTITFRAPAETYDEALLSIIRQSLSGQQPDVHFVGSHLLGELVDRGLVEPMDDLLEGVDLAELGFAPETLALGQIDGRQYGLPWTASTPVAFFNVDLVREAGGDPENIPTDWDGLIDLAGRIDALGPNVMGMYWELGTDDWMTQNLLRSAGLPMMAEGDLAFDNETGVAAIDLFRRFHAEGGQEPVAQTAARQQFYAGDMGFYFVSTAAVRSFGREVGDRFGWDTAPVPTLGEGGGVVSGGMAAVILTDDPAERRAAFDYIRFGTGAEMQALVVQNTGYMPTNAGAVPLLEAFYAENPSWKTSVDQMDRASPWFAWPGQNATRIGQTINDAMTAMANGQTDAPEILAAITQQVRALLPQE